MQKRLLIVCDAFPPAFAPRVGYLCKLIARQYDITILTEQFNESNWPIDIDESAIDIHSFDFQYDTRKLTGKLKYGCFQMLDYLFCHKDRIVARKAKKMLKNERFDLVFCSSYYQFPLLCAKKLARLFNAPLCIDLRDIVEQFDKPTGFKKIPFFFKLRWLKRLQRNRILRTANATTTISPWHKQIIGRFCNNTELIYNGFDNTLFYPENIKTEKFRIVYTGRLLSLQMRNPQLLFDALEKLIADNKISAADTELTFYTDDKSKADLEKYSANYQAIKHILKFEPLVKMNKIPDILRQSSIILILTNKATKNGPHGIMTTKFFEAVGCEKPVVCVRSDEECLASAISDCNAGLAATNVADVEKFILDKYEEWKVNGYTRQRVNECYAKQFSRQNQAIQFTNLFNRLIQN